jgi:thiamine-monophosphate kinase
VAVCGALGHSAAGYELLTSGDRSASPALAAAHLRPSPPYDAGPEAARLGATAMIDVSDGLLSDLGHIAAASGVAIDVERSAVLPGPEDPLSSLAGHGSFAGARILDWVLAGGEDHALAATFPPGTALPARWRVIGAVVPEGRGTVTVDGAAYPGPGGWQHFR